MAKAFDDKTLQLTFQSDQKTLQEKLQGIYLKTLN